MQVDKIKKTNIEDYNNKALFYNEAMGYQHKDIESECERIKTLLGENKQEVKLIGSIKLLEIGTGTGISRTIMSMVFPSACFIATDISLQMLKEYKRNYNGTMCIVCDAENLPFKKGTFEMVVCSSFVHHLPTDKMLLLETNRVLKKNGLFVGIREPKQAGCDFWFRVHHIARRYGDRNGLKLLVKRLYGSAGGWKMIWSYEIPEEDFIKLDTMEIRGAILHPTPTKTRGGIDAIRLKNNAAQIYNKSKIAKFGFVGSFFDFISILFQRKLPHRLIAVSNHIDKILANLFPWLPFESFSFVFYKGQRR